MNQVDNSPVCPLCHNKGVLFDSDRYYLCGQCRGIYLHPDHYPDPSEERARYETHNNDVDDPGYREFVSPVTSAICRHFGPEHTGLDFGAGTGPVITSVLREKGYQIALYDPFFHPHEEALSETYNYIACCEVIEHFHSPGSEFKRLRTLLKPGGSLYCMTHIYRPDIDFDGWYYKRDPTHVFFYQEATCEWIRRHFYFKELLIRGRFIHFSL